MTLTDILGDYIDFYETQQQRLLEAEINTKDFPLSHMAYRCDSDENYLNSRDAIEKYCSANVENVWDGRPISKLLLKESISLSDHHSLSLIELIPPPHEEYCCLGLEHIAYVPNIELNEFLQLKRACLSAESVSEPYFLRFDDDTQAKFYRSSLQELVVGDGHRFDNFYHADPESR